MEFKTPNDILDYAIGKEKQAKQFYLDISEEETLSGNRQVFKDFAQEEEKHVVMLELFTAGAVADGIEGAVRQHLAEAIERSHTGVLLHPLDGGACGLEYACGRRGDFRADSITRDENDLMRCHFQLQPQD